MIGGVIGGFKGPFVGGAQIVGRGTGDLAGGLHPALALGEIPANRPRRGIGRGDGPGKAAQHRLVELGPELQQGKGAIEPHIEALVPGVIQALEHAELTHRIGVGGGGPEAAAAGQVVELIEEGHAQGLGQIGALQHRLLPGVDRITPGAPIVEGFGGDGPGLVAIGPKEIGVAAQGPGAGGKGRNRQIPADHQGNLQAFPRRQLAAHRQGGAGWIGVATAAAVVAVGDRAIAGKGGPDFAAIATGIPAAAAQHLGDAAR